MDEIVKHIMIQMPAIGNQMLVMPRIQICSWIMSIMLFLKVLANMLR